MTVYIEKPAVNLREELASLRNQGGYEERQFYFDNLVTNGTFDTDLTGWTDVSFGTGSVSQSGGEAVVERVDSGNQGILTQGFPTISGRAYVLVLDKTSGTGSVRVGTVSNGQDIVAGFTPGANEVINFVAQSDTTYITLRGAVNPETVTYDNIYAFETDGTDVVHRMPKGWVPLHVYEDGLLQREGAAHDYEVVYDGFDYYVKPAVAPGATTETCVIGVRK